MIGQFISHYRILEKLGEGGMGVVYKALDTTLDRTVALKFISAAATADESMKQRLEREARACAALNHPNIMTVYELGETAEQSYIAMEFVEGRTLQDLLKEKQIELHEVLDIALQVLDGLGAAHGKGIVHRDLKSANIMLDAHGRAKIMDFGLAKLAQASVLTQAGSTVGTMAYMSPEQARGEEADHRSDIYSLGVVLYQLLTGQLPFPYPHQLAVMYAVVNEDPKLPRELNPDVPPELEHVVLTAMAKNPTRRFQSCAEMAAKMMELEAAMAQGTAFRKRFRHLLQDTGVQPSAVKARKVPFLTPSRVYRYIIPLFVFLVAAVFGLVKLTESGEPEGRQMARSHVDRATQFMQENKADSARRELELAVQSDSTYSPAWATLAAFNTGAKRYDLAIEQARRAVAFDENNSSGMYNLAYALEEVGELEEAIVWYKEAIAKDSLFILAYSALANVYVKTNKPNDAVQLLLKGEQMNPASTYRFLLYKNLGKAHIALRDFVQAREWLQRSLELRSDVPETLYLLASAYEALSMTKESAAMWQQYAMIEKDPAKQAEARRHIEQLKGR